MFNAPSFEKFYSDFIGPAEGGYTNHPADKGGETNRGVTIARFRQALKDGVIKTKSIKDLTKADAAAIFKHYYFRFFGLDRLPGWIGLFGLDAAVNSGYNGIKILQRTIAELTGIPLKADGKIGPKTIAAAELVAQQGSGETFVEKFTSIREHYYRAIVASRPSQGVFLKGWLNRNNNLRRYYYDQKGDYLKCQNLIPDFRF